MIIKNSIFMEFDDFKYLMVKAVYALIPLAWSY